MIDTGAEAMAQRWSLRRAVAADGAALHALLSEPAVYRFLLDGVPPERAATDAWIAGARGAPAGSPCGLWLLEGAGGDLAGCVRLGRRGGRRLELTYALHPRHWGCGLATRMSRTVIEAAFASGCVDTVLAGADVPNRASLAVMRRLGMRWCRDVVYPLGPGVEYELRRDDPLPTPSGDMPHFPLEREQS